jgi:hypothetical protein
MVHQVQAVTGYSRKAYLDFDTGALSGTVTDAALNIQYTGFITSGTLTNMQEFSVYGLTGGQTWDESTLTWNNAPGNEARETSGLINTSNTVLLATFTVVTNAGKYSVVISSSNIVNYLNWAAGNSGDFYGTGVTNDATPTFVITAAYGTPTGLGLQFASSEYTTEAWRPSLTVTTIPEPTTIGLLMVSSVGILFARRCLRR